ncbi:MAG: hypothetical protein NWS20_00375 [Rickettsiaceae bacterium]|nr:hypothetical protein [Rickettsiaceae bacterium]MDP4832765.1 hypothetical protein [Rickettsiaceae bacterium]MDP5020669.1 hypothetical protein [Rickettsiaceae bacterium]
MRIITAITASLIAPTSSYTIVTLKNAIDLNNAWRDGYERGSEEKYIMVQKAIQNFIQSYDNEVENNFLQLVTDDYDYDYDQIDAESRNVFTQLLYNDKNKLPANIYYNLASPLDYTIPQDSTEYSTEKELSGYSHEYSFNQ